MAAAAPRELRSARGGAVLLSKGPFEGPSMRVLMPFTLVVSIAGSIACCCPTAPNTASKKPTAATVEAETQAKEAKEPKEPKEPKESPAAGKTAAAPPPAVSSDESPMIRIMLAQSDADSFKRHLADITAAFAKKVRIDGKILIGHVSFWFGQPDHADDTAREKVRPPMVTRWFEYRKERVHFVFGAELDKANGAVRYWQLLVVADMDTAKLISADEMERRLKERASTQDAKDAANRKAYEEECATRIATHEKRLADYEAACKAFAEAQAAHVVAKEEYDAARKLATARILYDDGQNKARAGIQPEASKLLEFADRRFAEIIRESPKTQAAKDAKLLLARKAVAARAIPAAPKEPSRPIEPRLELPPPPQSLEVVADGDQSAKALADGDFQNVQGGAYQTAVRRPDGRTVYVRGYFRRDGTYVAPHARATPGSGAAKGRRP